MKKFDAFERMNPLDRRNFLKSLGLVLASPLIPADIRYACNEIVLGANEAYANAVGSPSFFIEINLRDQFDLGHVFCAPGLATGSVPRGGGRGVPLYDNPSSLVSAGNRFFIPTEGRELIPHLDTVAVVELCELPIGNTHGHEAANATRSPGRTYNAGSGRTEMNAFEQFRAQGNEFLYSSTPTPAILHNYYMRQLSPSQRNGIIYKGVFRSEHTCYHHSAGLAGAQMDRFQNSTDLLNAFNGAITTPTTISAHRAAISQLINMVDSKFLSRMHYESVGVQDHSTQLANLSNNLSGGSVPVDLSLTPTEIAYWSSGVSNFGTSTAVKGHLWEQCALAVKLMKNNLVRSVALEFCHGDEHVVRDENIMRAYGTQIGYPLARLIDSLKQAGIYNNTVIAVYTTDGSREPYGDSYGNVGKNAVVLAGGGIRGGYYGDIQMSGGNFTYFAPDVNTGNPGPGTQGNDMRISGASIWKTVMKAAGVPSSLYNSFPDVAGAPELNFMLR